MKALTQGFRLKAEWWALAVLLSGLAAALTIDRTMERFDNLIYDHWLRVAAIPASDRILIVAIDDESLRRLGRWPWQREMHARLIDQMSKAQPRAIAYDVLFIEPGPQEGDRQLAESMAKAGPLFVPLSFEAPGKNGAAFDVIEPLPAVRAAADGVGHVNVSFDPDGLVRRADMSFRTDQHTWPHIMKLVAQAASPPASRANTADAASRLIPFAGSAGHWPMVSAASVVEGEVPAELLRDRLILVGATASALGDRYAVPMGAFMPGIEIQAHLLNGLLTGQMIGTAGMGATLAFALAPLWFLLIAFRELPRSATLVCTGVMGLLVLLVSAAALILFRTWLPPGAALTGLCAAYPLWVWRQLASADGFMNAELRRFEAEPDLILQGAALQSGAGGPNSTAALLQQAIAQAREMRHFLSARIDQLPDATLIADNDGIVLRSNAAARALFDRMGMSIQAQQNLKGISGQFRVDLTRGTLALPVDAEIDVRQEQFSHEVAAGDGRTFNVVFARQRSSAAEPIGWVIRISDISEAKAAQRQREDILQLLTHDMRSPQASIVAVLETAGPDQIDAAVSARIRYYAQRTLGLADGFVQLARAEALQYVLEEVDLFDMLTDAVDDLWPQSAAKDISLETHGEAGDLIVLGERSLLTRALINVIGNALKYSDPGTRVVCRLSRMQGKDGTPMAACSITDEGPGLAPGHRTTIFERFNRGPLGVGGRVDGVGLGLSFSHTVMVRHKGEIRCESEPGQGATFTLLLPLVEPGS